MQNLQTHNNTNTLIKNKKNNNTNTLTNRLLIRVIIFATYFSVSDF